MAEEHKLTPWLTAAEAAGYLKRGRRFVLREIKSGRMRGAIVGGRREVLTRTEWCDQWVEEHSAPVEIRARFRRS
jgi:excisionase family DNA binding protein